MKLKKLFAPLSILDNIKMRQKLILIYFILIILPLSFFTVLTYLRTNETMRTQTLNSGSQVFDEACKILDTDFNSMYNVTKVITLGDNIYTMLLNTYKSRDMIDEITDKTNLENLFIYLKSNTSIANIHLYTFGDKLKIDDNSELTNIKYIQHTSWYKSFMAANRNNMWLDPVTYTDNTVYGIHTISYIQKVYDPTNLSENIALLKVDLNTDRVDSIIKNTLITKNCVSYLVNGSSLIRSASLNNDNINQMTLDSEQLSSFNNQGWKKMKLDGTINFINVKQLNHCGWYFITVMPEKDVAATGRELRNEMLISMSLISLFAYLLAYFISASTIKRLSQLSKEMKKVEKGFTEVSLVKKGEDEIGVLMEEFNFMVSKINHLADEKYKLGIDVKNLELKALQAQINPHFLYNTLEMINCSALKNKIPEIAKQVTTLAKFYKLSLSKGNDVVTLDNELEHVKAYIQIQNMRYEGKINYTVRADEDLLNYKTLKIILQPIVENSIIHGIFEKEDPCGSITITVRKESDDIFITVEDDGIGMEKEQLDQLLDYEMPSNMSGYGIKNIDQRIRLYYGQEYGLTYWSTPGIGTKVTVHIPAVYI